MKKVEYIASGGETGFTSSALIAKRIVGVYKDGVGRSIQLTSGTPTDKQFRYTIGTGQIEYGGEPFNIGEPALVLYEDAEGTGPGCISSQIGSTTLPNAFIGRPYSASFFVNGTAPHIMSGFTAPAWLDGSLIGNTITISGTPSGGDLGTADISFSIANACGSDSFSQTINVFDPARNLTFNVTTFAGVQIQVTLDAVMDLDVGIQSAFGDGYVAADCSGSASAAVQLHDKSIPAGSVNVSDNMFPTGDWDATNSYHVYNVIVNNVVRFNGDVVTMGGFDVTIVLNGC